MTTKGRTGKRTAKPRAIPRPARRSLSHWLDAAVGFLLGAVLSGAELFGLYAPFGVAATAAAGSGITGFATMSGACLGYLCLEGINDGMRYAASAILTYSVAFAFYDTRLYRRVWFMPAVAMTLSALTGFICRGGGWWYGQDMVYFATEVLLTGAAAGCYSVIYARWPESLEQLRALTPRQSAGVLMLAGTVLMALGRIQLLRTFSLGRLLAALGVMAAARQGVTLGVMTGACAGVALDLTSVGLPGCSLLYTLAGLSCGLCRDRRKIWAAAAYCLTAGFAILWIREDTSGVGLFLETAVGVVLFLLLPVPAWTGAKEGFSHGAETEEVRAQRLRRTASAFHALTDVMRSALGPEAANPENPADLFTRAADQVCAKCVLRATCWQKDYQSTRAALNDATQPALDRGRALATDFPGHFSTRCVNFPSFLREVNVQLTGFLRRRQALWRSRETRSALLTQYGQLDKLLRQTAEAAAALVPDKPRQERLAKWLWERDLPPGAVYRDGAGRLHVETPAVEDLTDRAMERELSQLLGVTLGESGSLDGRLHFTQTPPLLARVAQAGAPRRRESVSGDTGLWFRRPDGMLFLLLCDGMGSGPEAQRESQQTAQLVQRFLQAGMDPAQALETVASALALRGDGAGGTSVDLLAADLFTGECCVYKQGAAPSYVRRSGQLRCAVGTSLPAGLAGGAAARPDAHGFQGQAGDWVVLLSDGVLCGRGDAWLRTLLEGAAEADPQTLADAILQAGQRETQGEDDSTVMVLYLEQAV